MLNYFWAVMLIIGIVYGAFTGSIAEVGDAAFSSAGEAVELCFTMCGIMAFWVGLMKVAERSGMVAGLTKVIRPFVHFMFPKIPENHRALQPISVNIIANILGLGWAATPAGLEAMKELSKLEEERKGKTKGRKDDDRKGIGGTDTASDEMCDFLILNISSLQLIPVTMIAYRLQYGSEDPAAIIAPAILATTCSTLAAIVFCKLVKWKKTD